MNNFGKKLLFSVLSFFLGTTLAFSQNTVKHTLSTVAKPFNRLQNDTQLLPRK